VLLLRGAHWQPIDEQIFLSFLVIFFVNVLAHQRLLEGLI
jgi:hypothetical protein